MSLTATLKNQSVSLSSGAFACEISVHFPMTGGGFNILGLYLNETKHFGSHFAVYTFKLIQANLVAEIYPHGNKTGSNGCCVWRDLEYGVRAQEAYARATADLRNPLSLEDMPTGIYGTITVEYVLKENSTEIIRRDTLRTEHPLYHVELQQFCQIPQHQKTEGLLHHALSDGTDAAAWQSSGKITVTPNDDVFIGKESLRFTIPAESQGKTICKKLTEIDCSADKYLCLAIKPKKETNVGEALQFFIENAGKRFTVGHSLSLYQLQMLHEDKHKHYQRGEWRQVFFDIGEIPRDKVIAIGFEVLNNAELHVNVEDIWIYRRQKIPFTGESNRGYAVTQQFPAKAYEEKTTEVLQHTIQSYFVHYSTQGAALSIQCPFQNAERVVHYAKNDPTLKVYASTKYNPNPANAELTCWNAESVFVVRQSWEEMQAFSQVYNAPRFLPGNKTLPAFTSLPKLLQMRPTNPYDSAPFLANFVAWGKKTLVDEQSAPCGLVIGGGSATACDYKMPDSVLYNTQWKNVLLDTRQDLYLLTENILKSQGLPLCAESFAAVTEGAAEIPFYDRRHLAKGPDGKDALRMVWVYETAEGETLTQRTTYSDLARFEYYQPQSKNGKVYTLSYTYPSCRVNLISQFLSHTEAGFETLGDYRLKRIEYILQHYTIDAIVLSEDCTNYEYGWTVLELRHYNQWRVKQGLKALKDFNRFNNNKVVGASNPYRCDDAELWAWKNELTKAYVKKVAALCHQYGVACIVDVNIETTLPIQDKNNPLYRAECLKQDEQGNWHTRDFDLLGARFGTKLTDMLEVSDFLYVWLYGNYSPWGAQAAYELFLGWLKDKPWQGRLLLSPGFYPSHNQPNFEDIRAMLSASIPKGYGAVIPGLRNFETQGLDITKAVLELYQQISQANVKDDVLSFTSPCSLYCLSASTIEQIECPDAFEILHLNKQMAILGRYATSQKIECAAGDSLVIQTNHLPSIEPIQFDVGNSQGEGMVACILKDLMQASGLQTEDFNTSQCHANLYGLTLDGTLAAIDVIKLLNQVAFFDSVQEEGRLQFKQRKAKQPCFIPSSDMQVHHGGEVRPESNQGQQNTRNLPQTLQVTYQSIEDDYWSSTQSSTKVIAKGVGKVSINLPIALNATQAQTIADILHYQAIIEQDEVTLSVGTKYFHLLPGDCITIKDANGQDSLLRIEAITSHGPYLHQLRCVKTRQQLYERTRKGIERPYSAPKLIQPAQTHWQLLNLPKLDSAVKDTPQAYFVCYSNTEDVKRWPGTNLFRETESGLELITQQTLPATAGYTQGILGPASETLWDKANSITVVLMSGVLGSVTEMEALNGKNVALIGDEIIQFVKAELIGPKTYRLSQLLRGRKGTESNILKHTDKDRFILLESGKLKALPMLLSQRNQIQDYKVVTFNLDPDDVGTESFTYHGDDLKPLAPVHLKAKILRNTVALSWIRQSRLGGTWLDHVDTPLGEAFERYEVEVLHAGKVIETLQTTQASLDYPYRPHLSFRIYQLSELAGRGAAGEITL